MQKVAVKIKLLSPIHLSSGQADVEIDAQVVCDKYGLPYFPARRWKGLLYESALETIEMAELCQKPFIRRTDVEELFQHGIQTENKMIVTNFYLPEYKKMQEDWSYLQEAYPRYFQKEDVLACYSSVRYQTQIDAVTGTAKDTSLHNMNVIDAGLIFQGQIQIPADGKYQTILALALRNLQQAGSKRNRGFGKIDCTMAKQDKIIEDALKKAGI